MRRRLFMLATLALAAPLVRAQAKLRRVGILSALPIQTPLERDPFLGVFLDSMAEMGHVNGKTVSYEWRSASGQYALMPKLASELVASGVDVIVAQSTPGARAAKQATKTIPIVFVGIGDPVATGLVASLAKPNGNATGVSNFSVQLDGKRIELAKQAFPGIEKVGVLLDPSNPTYPLHVTEVNAAARSNSVRIVIVGAKTPAEIDEAFETFRRERVGAVVVQVDSFFQSRRAQIASMAIATRLPTMLGGAPYVEAGGLMSYAHRPSDQYRKLAEYVDRILKGADPATLPVDQPSKLELIINIATAKAIGVKLPPEILARADRVIE